MRGHTLRGWVFFLLVAFCILTAGVGEAATIDWVDRVYASGEHDAFTDLVSWQGHYYVCFRHGASHSSLDGEIRVLRSADMRKWEPAGVINTPGDDRDPHFAIADGKLHVFFGTWDIVHMDGAKMPDRKSVRSYMSVRKGEDWSRPAGTYDAGWWLWRVSHHEGAFYSAAYTAVRPKPEQRETRLLTSPDGIKWKMLSTVTTERLAGEADLQFEPDGAVWLISRANDEAGTAIFARSNSDKTAWTVENLDVLVHSPAIARWKDRLFVAGRGKADSGFVTRIWEIVGVKEDVPELKEVLTLPSGGDTAYPGLLADPASLDGQTPALFVTWYSQHENEQLGAIKDAAAIYAARVTVD